jgi:Flp pilus assembly protein TadG
MYRLFIGFSKNRKAASAVEFAFVAPILLLLLFGIVGYGYVFGVYHGIQQIASEAARASVSGLDDTEREKIARDFVAAHAASYAFIDPAKIRMSAKPAGALRTSFEVAITYDMSGSIFNSVGTLLNLPQPMIERKAVIQRGGY